MPEQENTINTTIPPEHTAFEELSQKRLDILILRARGYQLKTIASIMGYSHERSVKNEGTEIHKQLGVSNPYAAIAGCLEKGILPIASIIPQEYDWNRIINLTENELNVLKAGFFIRDNNEERISNILDISKSAVKMRFKSVRSKLDTNNSLQSLSYYTAYTLKNSRELQKKNVHDSSWAPGTSEVAEALSLGFPTGVIMLVAQTNTDPNSGQLNIIPNQSAILAAATNRKALLQTIDYPRLSEVANYFKELSTVDSSPHILPNGKDDYAFMCIDSSDVLDRAVPIDPITREVLISVAKEHTSIKFDHPNIDSTYRRLRQTTS